MLLQQHQPEIEAIVARYASKRSAVLPLLYLAQDTYGYLTSEAIREVAAVLDLPPTAVFEVVGFYTLFYNRPVGTWMLQVCDDVPCCYLGAEELITALKQTLGIVEEQTTADGMFTLQRVKCLAACDRAPVLQANLDYVYDVSADKVEVLLRDLRTRAAQAQQRGVSGRFAEDFDMQAAGPLRAAFSPPPVRLQSETPTAPETPVEAPPKPEAPDKIEAPTKPEAPEKIEDPAKPETPDKIEAPTKPEAPEKIEDPAKPEAPDKIEAPAPLKAPQTEPPAKSEPRNSPL